MNFTLNDRSIDYTLTNDTEFKVDNRSLDFYLNAVTSSENFRLLEDGDFRLLEDGGFRLLE